MAHLHRFYVPASAVHGDHIMLPEEEAHHAIKVVRIRDGECAAVFDGQGHEWSGTIHREGKRDVAVHVTESREAAPPLPLTLCVAWLHRDKAVEEIIKRGTELGVTHFTFFRAAHSQSEPKQRDKWDRLAIEACKQCGRLWLPGITTADAMLDAWPPDAGTVLVCTADHPPKPIRSLVSTQPVTLFVGPEGDWTNAELAEATARGAVPVSLGDTVFRAEIAAITAATLVQYERGLLGPC